MNFDLTHEQQMIYDYGQSLTKTFDQAYWRDHVERKAFPEELTQQIASDGFLGIMVPEQYGGAGLGMQEQVIFMEGLSHAGFPMLELVASSTMSIPLVAEFGTEEQKQKYIPPCCDGSATFCFMITEAAAGSNAMAINTLAKKRGDKYYLNGQKTFISLGGRADFGLVVARTTALEDAPNKAYGFTLFLVDMKAKGIGRQLIDVSVPLTDTQWIIFFDDVELTEDNVLGEVDKGFEILFDTLNPERIVLSGLCNGIGRMALEKAVEYASERVVFKGPIGAYQGLQHPLAAAKTEVEMASLMTLKAAWLYDNDRPCGPEANMAKYFAAEASIHAVDASLQCFGGNGFTKEYGIFDLYPIVRLFRTAPLNREIILSYIGEKVLGLPRSY